jgi:hypothetical protein
LQDITHTQLKPKKIIIENRKKNKHFTKTYKFATIYQTIKSTLSTTGQNNADTSRFFVVQKGPCSYDSRHFNAAVNLMEAFQTILSRLHFFQSFCKYFKINIAQVVVLKKGVTDKNCRA